MAKFLRKTSAFTLIELMIVSLLLSVVFLGSAAAYVSALKFLKSMQTYNSQADVMIAMEQITRKVVLANFAEIDEGGQELKFQWDYQLDTFAPNNTPSVYTDDTWVKFAIIGGKLYWRNDATVDPDVSSTDTEVVPGLILQPTSGFTLTNPTSTTLGSVDPVLVGLSTVVNIVMITQTGTPPITQKVETSAMVGAWPKN